MKKFYLLLCAAALGLTAQARQLTFYIDNQAITPGSTVEFSDVLIEEDGGVKYVTMAPSLSLGADLYMKVDIVADCTSGQTVQMCAGGACKSGKKVVKENIAISTGSKLPLKFEYEGEFDTDEKVADVTTAFSAVCADYPETAIQFILVMGTDLGSVTAIAMPEGLKLVPGGLEYDLASPAVLALYNAAGACVLNAAVEGHGTVSTASLPAGIYVYSLGGKSGKLYVK